MHIPVWLNSNYWSSNYSREFHCLGKQILFTHHFVHYPFFYPSVLALSCPFNNLILINAHLSVSSLNFHAFSLVTYVIANYIPSQINSHLQCLVTRHSPSMGVYHISALSEYQYWWCTELVVGLKVVRLASS